MKKKNSNNPFEAGNSNSPFENGTKKSRPYTKTKSSSATFGKERRSYSGLIIAVVIVIIIIVVVIASNWWKIKWYLDDLKSVKNAQNVEIVEDYTFDIGDVAEEYKTNPFPSELSSGQEFTIDQDYEKLIETEDWFETTLVAGLDFEPGVYTMKLEGRAYINPRTTVNQYLELDDNKSIYNIPFLPGDKLGVTKYDEGDQFKLTMTPQTEYVEYEPNKAGVYVYGLSNFEPQIDLNSDDYLSTLYCYPSVEYDFEHQNCEYLYDQNISLNGAAGSYFAIDYRAED